MELTGKNIIYIGGFGAIGQQCVRVFLEKDIMHLVICDLNDNATLMQELQTEFPNSKLSFIKLDITNTKNIQDAYKEAVSQIGHIDVVVNGCGIMDDRYIDLTIQINLSGVIHSTLTAMNYMDKSNGGQGGVIVNISSVAGLQPTSAFAVYSAAKHGVTAFTRCLGNPIYYERTGIAFITICPGFTDTVLLDLPKSKATFDYAAPLLERFDMVKRQTAAECAKSLVKAVEIAKNGSVWILDLGELKEVEIPNLWTPNLSS